MGFISLVGCGLKNFLLSGRKVVHKRLFFRFRTHLMASINTGPHINPKYTTDHPYCKDSQKRANSGKAPMQAIWSVLNLYEEHVDWRCNTFEVFGFGLAAWELVSWGSTFGRAWLKAGPCYLV